MKISSGDKTFEIEAGETGGTIDGKKLEWVIREYAPGLFQVVMGGKNYDIQLLKTDEAARTFTVRVNGNKYVLEAKDKYDELLHAMGFDTASGAGIRELKAPMPGLVLDVRVADGQSIAKGDALVVLEAMKMENVLRSPADLTVKKVHVKKGMTVDKNQVLVSF